MYKHKKGILKMKIKLIVFLSVIIILFLINCSSRDYQEPSRQSAPRAERVAAQRASMEYPENSSASLSIDKVADQPRMVIKNASLKFQVSNYDEALKKVQTIVDKNEGFILSINVNVHENNSKSGHIILRIPFPRFETTLQELKGIAIRVEQESITGEDVTEQFYDITARLSNKRKVESRFQEILKSAETVKDVLEIEKSLAEIREEIERLEGRKRYISDKVALSTINLSLREPHYELSMQGDSFWIKVMKGIKRGFDGVGDIISFILTILIAGSPIWIVLIIIGFFGIKYFRRFKSRVKDAS
jgi:hypothetical protein